jgi:catechol 2,3-dioxygenase-like lactoylglutathione lyase family enzyme
MIRLRQIALVAADLDAAVSQLCSALGAEVCFVDPGVGEFGLHNALLLVGDQFIEVVSPTGPGTTAGRLLEKRSGDGGYMVLYEVDDLDARMAALGDLGVRVVWSMDLPAIRGRHLHPRDVGGAIVSLDQPTNPGDWEWGGPTWRTATPAREVSSIASVSVSAADPEAMQARWNELGLDTQVNFVPAGSRGDGMDVVDLVATDRSRVGEEMDLVGVRFRLV